MFLLWKRCLQKPVFILLLFIIPVISMVYPHVLPHQDTRIQVGFYIDEDHIISSDHIMYQEIIDTLQSYEGNIVFSKYQDLERMQNDVAALRLECAYVIPVDLIAQLDAGYKKNLVMVYTNPSTTMTNIVNQVFYSCFFSTYSYHILENYVLSAPELASIETSDLQSELHSLYTHYLTDGSTFSFDYIITEQKTLELTSNSLLTTVYPFVLSILVFLCASIGFLQFDFDRNNRYFGKMPYQRYRLFFVSYIMPYIVIPSIIMTICFILSYVYSPVECMIRCAIYMACLFLLYLLFHLIHLSSKLFIALIPLYLCGCFIFTPILFDITHLFSKVRYFSWFFITTIFY